MKLNQNDANQASCYEMLPRPLAASRAMLNLLRRIVQEVNIAGDLDESLAIIVSRVREAMGADVCSVYLTDPRDGYQVLMATDGLNPEAVHRTRLAPGQGVVTLVVERAEPVNLEHAPNHPRFLLIPETSEEPYHSFLGVPIINHRKVLGVLITQRKAAERSDDDQVAFQVTVAAALAGAIAHAEASGGIKILQGVRPQANRRFEGLAGAPGVVIGKTLVMHHQVDLDVVPDRRIEDPEAEVATFLAAVEAVQADIRELGHGLSQALSTEESTLFDAYLLMLGSDSLVGKTVENIQAGNWAPGALRQTVLEHVRVFRAMDDPLLRERASDITDLGRRIMSRLQEKNRRTFQYPRRTILVAEEVSATMIAEVPLGRLAAVVSVHGSRYSHAAILARALGVPAVMGISDLPLIHLDNRELVVDGYRGHIYLDPSPAIRAEFMRLAREEAKFTAGLTELRELAAETTDGHRVPLYANTGLIADLEPARNSGAEGIGLYRTEIPFMVRDRFPGEEEQAYMFRQVLRAFAPRPVTMRTLDVGGDKSLPYFPIHEANPFLGWRGIRITLDHPEIFLTHLRAMVRASEGLDNLQILLPMVYCVSEVDDTLLLLQRAHRELLEEGRQVIMPKLGVMIEVPAAVYQIGAFARRVDFLSVGTNDLTQYLLAVDRNNERVAGLYDHLHPAVLRVLVQIANSAQSYRIPVGVCGEMAGDPMLALLLVGMGMDNLSMNAGCVPRVKRTIRHFSLARAQELLEEVLSFGECTTARNYLDTILEQEGLGNLVRPG
ncbi:phosphoenolpyruvate-protein phosphotransferase PtsP [Gammaproteobacteria bacterium]